MFSVHQVHKALTIIVLGGAWVGPGMVRAAPQSTAELAAHCAGAFKVESTVNAYYLPERCAGGSLPNSSWGCGRAPILPPKAGYSAVVTLTAGDAGCDAVGARYGIAALGTRFVDVTLTNATDLAAATQAANAAQGVSGTFELEQSFDYAVQGTLPLYPLAHVEELTFVGTVPAGYGTSGGTFALSYEVDAYKTYGVKPLEQLDAASTTALAKSLAKVVVGQDGHVNDFHPFSQLFARLNVGSKAAANDVLNVVLGLFEHEKAQEYPSSFFFEFNVGGSAGTVYAGVVNTLSYYGVLSASEKSDLLAQYPGLLLSYSDNCFQADAKILADALITVLAQIQAGEVPSKTASKWTLQTLALQLQGTHFGWCTKDLASDEVKALAQQILEAL